MQFGAGGLLNEINGVATKVRFESGSAPRIGGGGTPRTNFTLKPKLAAFSTLAAGLDYAAQGATGFNFYSPRGDLTKVLPYGELKERALETAQRLMGLGLARGDRVGLVAETGADFMGAFFACQYAG